MEITPQESVQVIAELLKRTPIGLAESVGAQHAVDRINQLIADQVKLVGELAEEKAKNAPKETS